MIDYSDQPDFNIFFSFFRFEIYILLIHFSFFVLFDQKKSYLFLVHTKNYIST